VTANTTRRRPGLDPGEAPRPRAESELSDKKGLLPVKIHRESALAEEHKDADMQIGGGS
jgi:hypothetical protein